MKIGLQIAILGWLLVALGLALSRKPPKQTNRPQTEMRGDVRIINTQGVPPSKELYLSFFDQSRGMAAADLSLQSEDDDANIPYYPNSNCFEPTPSGYYGVNISTCWQHSYDYNIDYLGNANYSLPDQCITNVSQLSFNEYGVFSTDQSFYNCLANVPDAANIPTYYGGQYHGCTFINAITTLLNLVKIDEISGSADLQIIMDYSWYDYRFAMDDFWLYADPDAYSGVDLTRLLTNDSIVMWLPEVTFPDAADLSVETATLTFYYPCRFVYEVVYDLSLVQPLFDFKDYPSDTQNIVIRATVMNYDAEELQLFPAGIGTSQIFDGTASFAHNAIWTWAEADNYCTVYYDKKMSMIWPAYIMMTVTVTRESNGVLVRLVVPLTLLILLSTLTFWISYESRVDTTITLLLAISALYIIILQNIPMVGYLTSVDKFVFGMFLLLCIIAAMHQVYATVKNKIDRWPLRPVYLRLIELLGRCCVPPIVMYYFAITVHFATSDGGAGVIMIALTISLLIFSREFFGIRATFIECMFNLVEKVNQPEITAKDLSTPETLALNIWIFNEFTFSKMFISRHLQEMGKIVIDTDIDVSLKNMFSLNSLLGRPTKSNVKNMNHHHLPTDLATAVPVGNGVSIEMAAIPQQSFNQVSQEQIGTTVRGSINVNAANPMHHDVEAPAAPFRRTIDQRPDSDDEEH